MYSYMENSFTFRYANACSTVTKNIATAHSNVVGTAMALTHGKAATPVYQTGWNDLVPMTNKWR